MSTSAEHPDLVELDRHIRSQLDRVLRAEQEAAELIVRRAATIRDRMIDLEEAAETVAVVHALGETVGVIDAVGADHIELLTASGSLIIPFLWLRVVRLL